MLESSDWRIGLEDGKVYRKVKKYLGGHYTGEIVDSKKHGIGKLIYPSGDCVYEGEFADDTPHGAGTLIWKEKEVSYRYEGSFEHGKRTGHGVYTVDDGTTYDGGFLDGKFEGPGTLTDRTGDEYKGTWTRGRLEGEDIEIKFSNGDSYHGQMLKGKFHGKGYYIYRGESGSYRGGFKHGLKHDHGKRTFSNESVYKGNYVCGKMDGMGIFRSKEGNCYEGYWKDDLYHGHGKLIFSNKTFIGEFSGGEFSNGYLVFFEDGDKKDCYKGSFKSDRWKHCKNFNDAAVSIPEAVFHGRGCRTW
eukprot:CAMPEP_0113297148 /NCGR_PEP_ID=MMETSP0010_2-20120614/129_1 /TAXON_ID=216773 ORGANISM="Corethron hystrix, Strain 308" /NCGR_SAMPLE_ID=MMETSP0010_2 /ASSEMBLY_ACC=CAM_ASM_000155 /LENGTH=301 /DNA_ID=CAMNT_0000149985 /DNA_START=394 /DNA_END=1296 /DNA_ORIENTATION=- /assembly_acc=CAM_ASM_000155